MLNRNRGLTFLIVDDDERIREMLAEYFAMAGIRTVLAEDGEQAIDIFRSDGEDYDLVLMDVHLPGLDGPTTLRVLRDIGMDSPAVFITGDPGDYPVDSLNAIGVSAVLMKPFNLDSLIDVVDSVALELGRV